jgi:hypothetical protein
MDDLTSGWGRLVDEVSFEAVIAERLPAACDRFYEARFFGQLARRVPAEIGHTAIVNWYVSAHVTAAIAVRDAAKADFKTLGRMDEFEQSELAMEFFLRSDALDPNLRDPLAVNRAYRDLRNLRVHHAKTLVQLRTRVLEADIAKNPAVSPDDAEPRWFLNPLDAQERLLLGKKAHVAEEELDGFNRWVDTRPLATVLCQYLFVLAGAIERTGRSFTA